MKIATLCLFCLFPGLVLAQATTRQAVLKAEADFAAQVAVSGSRAGFLAFTAPEGVVFEDGDAVNAPALWDSRPATGAPQLAWTAAWADAAQSGEMAYTTGTWRRGPNAAPAATGQYVTVWHKQLSGSWKFVVNMAIEHGQVSTTTLPEAEVAHPLLPAAQALPAAAPNGVLLALERKFIAEEMKAPAKTYQEYLSTEGRLYRPGQLALTGNSAQVVSENPGFAYLFVPTTVRLAASGDMGFAVGTLRRPSPVAGQPEETGSYLRIWRREAAAGWRLAVEMLNVGTGTQEENGNDAAAKK
jgi:ketosteroid isomerase-like protein